MTLDQIVKLQSIVDKRAIASDTLEFLNEQRFSESKQCMIRYGDMHIDHFLRVFSSGKFRSIFKLDDNGMVNVKTEISAEEMFNDFKQKIVKEFGNGNH
jgi:hypothetical protein